ncbi:hypothetical protein L1077_00140 [Pseudoalteromonas luteoviolacea]|nr:hypothetical protein [Pseudoalteromonas luteoviolacea]MCF6437849.1 hypothetical protein [Pseudoalteromonas luteoviolacea]
MLPNTSQHTKNQPTKNGCSHAIEALSSLAQQRSHLKDFLYGYQQKG